jgi:Ala-tRNA(Pro) deacylase
MNGQQQVYDYLRSLNIEFEYHEHAEAPTIEIARQYWEGHDGLHCKNIFLRNHKGKKHYLVVLDCDQSVVMKDLEQKLNQGKLSFASEQRMDKYLGLKPGSVSPFGLVNDKDHHVHCFFDKNLLNAEKLCFHPNINTASLTISKEDFLLYLDNIGNSYEFIDLY